jgi:hypothetical protein
VYLGDGDFGAHGLGEEILAEVRICLAKIALVVRIELDVYDLLMVRARDGDCGG